MTRKQLEKYRKALEEQKTAFLVNARRTLDEETVLDVNDLPDEIDLASSEYQQSMTFRLRDREKFAIKKIDKAIAKIDKDLEYEAAGNQGEPGEFGVCESCGEEISSKRLEARPVTDLCIRCKEDQEHREKAFG